MFSMKTIHHLILPIPIIPEIFKSIIVMRRGEMIAFCLFVTENKRKSFCGEMMW
jgi:hypothetical protein